MASFYAELQVAGTTYPVRSCAYEFTQSTNERGRVAAKVRHGRVRLTLDVPEGDELLSWAAAPFKPLAGRVVFRSAQGGAALETLRWEDGQCVGYREEFLHGSVHEGAYVCHLTIAAPKLTMAPGGPASYVSPAAGEHGSMAATPVATVLETAMLKAEELASGLVKKVITPAGEIGTEILGVSAAAIARTASLTLGLVLTPTNSRDDDGYKSEWDLGKLTQNPTDKDRARLEYLENEREGRVLSDAEDDELASLLAIVRKVFAGGRRGLTGYYTQQAEAAHLRQIVPDFKEIYLAGLRNEAVGEFDGINLAEKIFIEDKSAHRLNAINPRTGLPAQTVNQWADKHVYGATATRIEALKTAKHTYPQPAPDIE